MVCKPMTIFAVVVWIGGLFFSATLYQGPIASEHPVVHNVTAHSLEDI